MSTTPAPNFRFSIIVACLVILAGEVLLDLVQRFVPTIGEGLGMISTQVVALACALWFMRRRGIRSADLTGPLPSWTVSARWIGVIALLSVSEMSLVYLAGALGWIPGWVLKAAAARETAWGGVPFQALLIGCVIAPLTEELAFRGLVLRNLLQRMSPRGAVLVSAVVFALMHLQTLVLPQFVFAIVLGVAMLETRSLWLCVALHAFSNAAPDLLGAIDDLLSTRDPSFLERLAGSVPHEVALALLVSVILAWCVASVALIRRLAPVHAPPLASEPALQPA